MQSCLTHSPRDGTNNGLYSFDCVWSKHNMAMSRPAHVEKNIASWGGQGHTLMQSESMLVGRLSEDCYSELYIKRTTSHTIPSTKRRTRAPNMTFSCFQPIHIIFRRHMNDVYEDVLYRPCLDTTPSSSVSRPARPSEPNLFYQRLEKANSHDTDSSSSPDISPYRAGSQYAPVSCADEPSKTVSLRDLELKG